MTCAVCSMKQMYNCKLLFQKETKLNPLIHLLLPILQYKSGLITVVKYRKEAKFLQLTSCTHCWFSNHHTHLISGAQPRERLQLK